MWPIVALVFLVLAGMSLRGARWAYLAFVVLGLLFFPARVGFRLSPQACEFALDVPLVVFSLTNYAHIVLFTFFFLMTSAQFRTANSSGFGWAGAIFFGMGVLVEIAQGVTGKGHCRLRDLIPDIAGIIVGGAIVFLWRKLRRGVASPVS